LCHSLPFPFPSPVRLRTSLCSSESLSVCVILPLFAMSGSDSHPVQIVKMDCKSRDARDKLIALWQPHFEYVTNEQSDDVLTYEGFVPIAFSADAGNPDAPKQVEFDTEVWAFETFASEAGQQRYMADAKFKAMVKQIPTLTDKPPTVTKLQRVPGGFHSRGEDTENELHENEQQPLTVLNMVELDSAESVATFKGYFSEFARYVKKNEPNTLTFEAFTAKDNPNQLVLVERYREESDLLETHTSSEAYKTHQGRGRAFMEGGHIKNMKKGIYQEQQWGVWGEH